MSERLGFLLRDQADGFLMKSVRGVVEGQHPFQQAVRQRIFEECGYQFTEAVDQKFFRFDSNFGLRAQAVIDNVNKKRLIPIVCGIPHAAFATGPLTAKATEIIVEQTDLSNFYMTVASTLVDGKQGIPAYLSYYGWLPYLKAHQIETMPTIRAEDERFYTSEEIRTNAFANGRKILKLLAGDRGLIMFPEGSMDAGRTPKKVIQRIKEKQAAGINIPDLPYEPNNSKLAGIQKITDRRVIDMLTGFIDRGVQFQLWLTSVKNDEMIISPSTKSIPLKALWEFVRPYPSNIEVTLTAFAPLTSDNLVERIAEANGLSAEREIVVNALRAKPDMLFDHIAGREVAPYIDWNRRGYYHTHAQKVLETAGLSYVDKLPVPTAALPLAA